MDGYGFGVAADQDVPVQPDHSQQSPRQGCQIQHFKSCLN